MMYIFGAILYSVLISIIFAIKWDSINDRQRGDLVFWMIMSILLWPISFAIVIGAGIGLAIKNKFKKGS